MNQPKIRRNAPKSGQSLSAPKQCLRGLFTPFVCTISDDYGPPGSVGLSTRGHPHTPTSLACVGIPTHAGVRAYAGNPPHVNTPTHVGISTHIDPPT